MGLGLQRQQRRLGRLPRSTTSRATRPRSRRPARSADQRPRAADGQLLQRRLQSTPRARRSPTRGTSTATARRTRPPPTRRYTYTANGAYTAKLTVTDADGPDRASANVLISVGNRAPTVTIDDPERRPGRVLHGQDPVQGLRHRSRGRHDRRRHQLRRRPGQRSRSATTSTRTTSRARRAAGHLSDRPRPPATARRPTPSRSISARLHRQGRLRRHRAADRPRAGDPAAQDQAGGVLRLHRPRRRRRHRPATAGVTTETTTDVQGGGKNLGFIEDGDYVSYKPVNLKDVTAMRFRVASAGAGGTIEVRTGLADRHARRHDRRPSRRPAAGRRSRTSRCTLTNPPTGTHELFLVFRNRGSTQNLFNVNWFEFVGKGAATDGLARGRRHGHAATGGTAPLAVKFDADGDRPRRRHADLRVGLRRPRHDDGHLDRRGPDLHLRGRGHLHGHADRHRRPGRHRRPRPSRSRSTRPSGCINGYRDDFNGADLGAGWDVVRRDQTLTVADGVLTIPAAGRRRLPDGQQRQEHRPAHGAVRRLDDHHEDQLQGPGAVPAGAASSSTATTTTTRSSIASRPTPPSATRASRSSSSSTRSRARRATAAPTRRRNLAVDVPATTCYMRVKSDGTTITGEYSADGTTWTPVGQSAALPANAKVGVFALSNAATTVVDAKFDYVTLEGANVPAPVRPRRRLRRHRRWTRPAGTRSSARTRPSTPSPTAA